MEVATVLYQWIPPPPTISIASNPTSKLLALPPIIYSKKLSYPRRRRRSLTILALKQQFNPQQSANPVPDADGEDNLPDDAEADGDGFDLGWLRAFPHALTASMSNFLFGYHIGVMNGPIVSIARELGFEGNSMLEGLVVSIFIAGAFIGSLMCGSLMDRFGCRRTLQINTIPLVVGAILSGQAHSADEMLWGRFLVGLGIGVNTVLVPIYISEVAPTKYRGSLGSLCQVGTCLGIIASLFIGIPSENDPHWWRTMLYMASIPGLFLTLGMQFAVDSPRWLCKVGRLDEAKAIVGDLWGPSQADKAIEEFQSVITTSEVDSQWLELLEEPNSRAAPKERGLITWNEGGISSLTGDENDEDAEQNQLASNFFLAAAIIGGALFLLQQFAGINGVLYFSSLTFQDVGVTSAALASLYVGITNFAGALTAIYFIDKQGRRRLLIGSYLGMAFSMFLIVYAISFPLDEMVSHASSILGTLMYIFAFAIGAGPVTGLIIPELSSNKMRAKIMAFSFSVHWVCNFVVGLFFLELVEKFGVAPVYASFGGVSLLSALFAYYFIVETKGRSLEQIEMALRADFAERDD